MILAGALGNLHDRIHFNAVRDLLWLFPGLTLPFGLHWPGGQSGLYPWIFNIADVALLVGVALLLIIIWRGPKGAPVDQTAPD
jgi:lipoprotein signal peptidase